MPVNTVPSLHLGTPNVAAGFRVLRFLRTHKDASARLLTTRTRVDPLTRTSRAYGARQLDNPATDHADALTVIALSAATLKLHTADGDVSLSLGDIGGRPLWSQNAQGTVSAVIYEPATAAGRPLAATEQPAAGLARTRERFAYALASDTRWRARNLAGAMTELSNNAGISRTLRVSLTGQALLTEQRLLKPEVGLPDWEVTTENDTEEALVVCATYDATGTALSMTNAANVSTITAYDISASVMETRLRYAGQGAAPLTEVVTLRDVVRRADGAVLSQTAGSGVVETYAYDQRTQYLTRHSVARPAGHPSGALLISDLHYTYDPVGNILTLEDKGADPQWHDNQQATGLRLYTYDTCYRLTSATGRERAPVARHSSDPSGGKVWKPYSEAYSYDDGDNLTLISHMGGAADRRRELSVATGSNRATLKEGGLSPETGFLAGGLQKQLSDGRALAWYADNQLRQVNQVLREEGEGDDTEAYHYADGGTRTRKIHTVTVSGGMQATFTTYAGGCEVRQRLLTDQAVTQKHVVVSEGGGVRLVETPMSGKSHLRYSFRDHLGSIGGEMDDSGKVTAREEHAPYGGTVGRDEEAEEVSSLMQRTYRYSGHEIDATGLIYYGWRYYQPELSRWLSADPDGLNDGLNLFRFCWNNPILMTDPDGKHPEASLKSSLEHAMENFRHNRQPGEKQQDLDILTMRTIVESENARKGKNDSSSPGAIEYYSDVARFVSKLLKDQKTSGALHYQAIVQMAPRSPITGHFTAFDIYKPEGATRATLINVESVEGMTTSPDGRYVPNSGGIGLGLRDLYNEVKRRIPNVNKRPLVLIYETRAQKSAVDCAMFSIVNARAMSQFPGEFIDTHNQFSDFISAGGTRHFVSPGDLSDLTDISLKFFKYSHSNTVLQKLSTTGDQKKIIDSYLRRNNDRKLRVGRGATSMNVGIEVKRINIVKAALDKQKGSRGFGRFFS